MREVPRRTVVGDIDRRFDNLSRSHHQSHVNCVLSVYGTVHSFGLLHAAGVDVEFLQQAGHLTGDINTIN